MANRRLVGVAVAAFQGAGGSGVVEDVVEHAPREPLPERAAEADACEERGPAAEPRVIIVFLSDSGAARPQEQNCARDGGAAPGLLVPSDHEQFPSELHD